VSATKLGEVTDAKPANAKPRAVDRRDVVPAIIALLCAGAVAAICWSTFDWHNVIGVTLVALATFVLTLVAAEVVRADDDELVVTKATPVDVDLTKPESELPQPHLAIVPDQDPADDKPLRQRKIRGADVVELFVAAGVGFCIAELVRILISMQSTVGFAIWWYAAFLLVFFFLARDRGGVEAAVDRVVTAVVWSIATLVVGVLAWMIGFVVARGLPRLAWSFFTEDLSKVGPLSPGGGAHHAIIGTLEQVGIATVIVVPIAIMTAVYLNEINGRMAKPIRFITEALNGLPSIVAGLLIFTIWVQRFGFSGLAGAFALAVLMLPIVTRTSEEILRTVPDSLREGSLALGSPRWRLVQKVVLPTALTGLVTAVILGIARAIGETAPMLLTAFGNDRTITSPNAGPQSDLPLMIWKLIREPVNVQQQRAWTGALVLVIIVFTLFATARFIAGRSERRLRRTS
jgi:phosphate transport system permease protein